MIQTRKAMLSELKDCFYAVREDEINDFIDEILKAKKVFIHAGRRELLMLEAFGMKLHQLGLKVHVIGDVNTPAIGLGDLMIVACGPDNVSANTTQVDIAKKSGATVIGIIANKGAEKHFDKSLYIPAHTKLVRECGVSFMEPIFEQVLLLIEEYMALKLKTKLSLKAKAI